MSDWKEQVLISEYEPKHGIDLEGLVKKAGDYAGKFGEALGKKVGNPSFQELQAKRQRAQMEGEIRAWCGFTESIQPARTQIASNDQ